MKWIGCQDGSFLNVGYIKELRLEENENALEEDGSDAFILLAITSRLHEDIANIVRIGTEEKCRYNLLEIIENDSGA